MPKVGKSSLEDRLHRIEGQVRGIEAMVKENREIDKVLVQVQAVVSSLESVKLEVIKKGIKDNFEQTVLKSLEYLK